MEFLVSNLVAPLASFGGPTANERRSDAGGPMRSSIVGLLSACLGFDRSAHEEMAELSRRTGILIRMDRPGDLLVDYHTTQSASEAALKRWEKVRGRAQPTRREYIVHARTLHELETSISERDYRTDTLLTLVLWERGETGESGLLRQVADAMRRPVFLPSLGRKTCHLSLPMNPRLVRAGDVIQAMDDDPFAKAAVDARSQVTSKVGRRSQESRTAADFVAEAYVRGNMRPGSAMMCHCDMDAPLGDHMLNKTLAYRRDEPRDRVSWTFSERREVSFLFPETKAA